MELTLNQQAISLAALMFVRGSASFECSLHDEEIAALQVLKQVKAVVPGVVNSQDALCAFCGLYRGPIFRTDDGLMVQCPDCGPFALDPASQRSWRLSLIKNIAIIDLFRNGSGLAADNAVIGALFFDKTSAEIETALQKLSALKVALYKSYTGAWSVFEGSDFDIDAAIAQSLAASPGVDYSRLAQLMGLHPVVAKRHYHETGSMRWMELSLCSIEQAEKIAADFTPKKGEFGVFILAFRQ